MLLHGAGVTSYDPARGTFRDTGRTDGNRDAPAPPCCKGKRARGVHEEDADGGWKVEENFPVPPSSLISPPSPPTFQRILQNEITREGEQAEFTCVVKRLSGLSVTWSKDGRELTSGRKYRMEEKGCEKTLCVASVRPQDAGVYQVTVSNGAGSCQVTSHLHIDGIEASCCCGKASQISIRSKHSRRPVFSKELSAVRAYETEEVTLSCDVRATEIPEILWFKDGALVQDSTVSLSFDGRTAELRVARASLRDAGAYSCVARDGMTGEEARSNATLEVARSSQPPPGPVFHQRPQDVMVMEGETVELRARVKGLEPMAVTWTRNSSLIPDSSYFCHMRRRGEWVLMMKDVFLEDEGVYLCEARNSRGKATCSCRVRVEPLESGSIPFFKPHILSELHPTPAEEGSPTAFTARFWAVPSPLVRWFLDERPVEEFHRIKVTDGCGQSVLEIADLRRGTQIAVRCEVTNVLGSASQTTFLCVAPRGQRGSCVQGRAERSSAADPVGTPPQRPSATAPYRRPTPAKERGYDDDDDGGEDAPSGRRGRTTIASFHGRCKAENGVSHEEVIVPAAAAAASTTSRPNGRACPFVQEPRLCTEMLTDATCPGECDEGSLALPTANGRPIVLSEKEQQSGARAGNLDFGDLRRSPVAAEETARSGDTRSCCASTGGAASTAAARPPPDQMTTACKDGSSSGDCSFSGMRKLESLDRFAQLYEVCEELGKGRFGVVRRVVGLPNGEVCAAKFIRCIPDQALRQCRREVEIVGSLCHPLVLRFVASYECPRDVILVTEYVTGGELFERVAADDFTLTEDDCILFSRQICEGTAYLHGQSVVHLDLKPENIMCKSASSNRIVIIDFGLARRLQPGEAIRVLLGTPEFIAPEVISYEPIGFPSDMWAIGVICYVLLSGTSPFLGETDAETFANITRGEVAFDSEEFRAVSEAAKDFVSKLLQKRPRKRMSAEECLVHPWLRRAGGERRLVRLPTDKLKKFMIRRKWQKTGNALRALSRMVHLRLASTRERTANRADGPPP